MAQLSDRSLTLLRFFLVLLLLCVPCLPLSAQNRDDSIFLAEAERLIFKVNSTQISPADSVRVVRELVPLLKTLGPDADVRIRSAASPEGPYENNRRLAIGRRQALLTIFEKQGVDASGFQYETAIEEYMLLVELMRQRHDPDYPLVRGLVDSLAGDDRATKAALLAAQDGKLFRRLLVDYIPQLRAVRVWIHGHSLPRPALVTEWQPATVTAPGGFEFSPIALEVSRLRREFLSVRTNLLEYAAYVPKYGWCPMPNVAVEYYPRRGHFTLGAAFDCPWWVGNTTNHKYFELRNYTLYGRYYFRSSNLSYDEAGRPNGQAAFKHFYLSAYGNAYLYQIGCNADDGWVGEGWGAGCGLGYVLPLGRRLQHWRIDVGATVGLLRTHYDPFVYGCPVDGADDGRYYYRYTGSADNFRRRQYRFSWLGPTRVELSVSYDLLYRRHNRRGVSLRSREKGGAL